MCLALSSSNSPRLSISARPALVLLQRTFSGRIKQFISPFPPPHPPPPVLSPARLPPSWLRSCGRSRRARCASLVWNSSDRSCESRQFPTSPPFPDGAISLHSPSFLDHLFFFIP